MITNINKMKKILFVCLLFSGIAIKVNAQAVSPGDSTENKSINVYNPNSVTEQSVKISENSTIPSGISSTPSRETETIHIYSGSQQGNNIVRTMEVPRPERK